MKIKMLVYGLLVSSLCCCQKNDIDKKTDIEQPDTLIIGEISLSISKNFEKIRGTVSVTLNSNKPESISRIEFLAGNTTIGESIEAPFTIDWNTLEFEDSEIELLAKVFFENDSIVTLNQKVVVQNTLFQIQMPTVFDAEYWVYVTDSTGEAFFIQKAAEASLYSVKVPDGPIQESYDISFLRVDNNHFYSQRTFISATEGDWKLPENPRQDLISKTIQADILINGVTSWSQFRSITSFYTNIAPVNGTQIEEDSVLQKRLEQTFFSHPSPFLVMLKANNEAVSRYKIYNNVENGSIIEDSFNNFNIAQTKSITWSDNIGSFLRINVSGIKEGQAGSYNIFSLQGSGLSGLVDVDYPSDIFNLYNIRMMQLTGNFQFDNEIYSVSPEANFSKPLFDITEISGGLNNSPVTFTTLGNYDFFVIHSYQQKLSADNKLITVQSFTYGKPETSARVKPVLIPNSILATYTEIESIVPIPESMSLIDFVGIDSYTEALKNQGLLHSDNINRLNKQSVTRYDLPTQ